MANSVPEISSLLGSHPSSELLAEYITHLSSQVASQDSHTPEIKSYSDAVYFNYFRLGLSFLFAPQDGYRPSTGLKRSELKDEKLVLDSIDFYNTPPLKPTSKNTSSKTAELAFSTHPVSPLTFTISAQVKDKDGKVINRPEEFRVSPETAGKDFVSSLGEPDRKGGGAGPSSGSIGIWCDWSKDGIMVEFGGDEARGPQAWERGKDAVWRVLTVFRPKGD